MPLDRLFTKLGEPETLIMKIAVGLFLTVTLNVSFGQNPFWVQMDRKIIRGISLIDKTKPTVVEQHYIKQKKTLPKRQNLGFGWSKWTATLPGGYTSVQCTFFYHNDSIVSYSLTSHLPSKSNLIDKYVEWFGPEFTYSPKGNISFDFHAGKLTRPLLDYNGNLEPDSASSKILSYMSPHSGLMYGYSGGLPITLLQNRQNFNAIKDNLSNDEVYLLMFSVNPASRLTAIEYYKRNPDKFENKEQIDNWIAIVYKEIPFVSTLMGCLGETWNSKELVEFCAQIKDE